MSETITTTITKLDGEISVATKAISKTNKAPLVKPDIEAYIASIPATTVEQYKTYWATIAPTTNEDYYRRWLFAFLSVHCGWQVNLKSYIKITSQPEIKDRMQLRDLVSKTSVGLVEMRTKGIWEFKESFAKNPDQWKKKPTESWVEFRNRTMNMAHGIGLAKTAFAIELCYPNECEVTCLDTHGLEMYGVDPKHKIKPKDYLAMEKHWVDTCKSRDIPPFAARNIYWNKIQVQENSRYWSSVFETKPSDVVSDCLIK